MEHCNVTEYIVPCSHIREYARSTANREDDDLHLAVKQYKPLYEPQDGDLTIIACHASAFPKELYEPIWDRLFARAASKSAGRRIRAVWIADVANQNKSGILNEGKLGNEPSWYDHARDYLHLVNYFRKEMVRPMAGFGHSMGGNVIVNLALLHPRLLSTVVAIEPIIKKGTADMDFIGTYFLTMKKDKWPSRDAAMSSILKSPFYAHWDSKVSDIFRQEGLRELPTALYPQEPSGSKDKVTLTTTKHQEALTFARKSFPESRDQPLSEFTPDRVAHPDLGDERNRGNAFYRPENTMTFEKLPFLRPSCLYIYGNKSHFKSSHAKGRQEKTEATGTATGGSGGVAEGKVKDVVTDGSHFVPFERPNAIAELAGRWFDEQHEEWHVLETAERKHWEVLPQQQKAMMDGDWMHWVNKIWGKQVSAVGGKRRLPGSSSRL